MAFLDNWFNVTFNLNFDRITGVICYGLVLMLTIIFQIIIAIKMNNSQIKSSAFRSFRLLYVSISFISFSYFTEHLEVFLSGTIFPGDFSTFLSIVGYTIAVFSLNLFILRIINFRTSIKRAIKILAIIEMILMVYVSSVFLTASFLTPRPIFMDDLLDYTIIIFGLIIVIAVVFTITSMLLESKNSANKMVKLRLRLAALGVTSVLIDGLLNIVHIILGALSVDDTKYYTIIMPIVSLCVLTMFMIFYYYSLFPSLYLQRITGVLPPSFTDLMKKQAELKKAGSGNA